MSFLTTSQINLHFLLITTRERLEPNPCNYLNLIWILDCIKKFPILELGLGKILLTCVWQMVRNLRQVTPDHVLSLYHNGIFVFCFQNKNINTKQLKLFSHLCESEPFSNKKIKTLTNGAFSLRNTILCVLATKFTHELLHCSACKIQAITTISQVIPIAIRCRHKTPPERNFYMANLEGGKEQHFFINHLYWKKINWKPYILHCF